MRLPQVDSDLGYNDLLLCDLRKSLALDRRLTRAVSKVSGGVTLAEHGMLSRARVMKRQSQACR
jgi:hypothetical protein